jgi:gluconate 2-dehydrogenase gamma chain
VAQKTSKKPSRTSSRTLVSSGPTAGLTAASGLSDASISRRSLISSAAISGAAIAGAAFVPLAALTTTAPVVSGQTTSGQTVPAVSTALSIEQRKILEAFIDRLVPKDENGPGALECGAADYIDRCLAGYLAPEKSMFIEGLSNVNAFGLRTQGAAFADLSAEKRDIVLVAIDTNQALNGQAPNLRGFFNRVRRLTLEGMFSDPVYGGNKNFAGWDLIGYPGAKLAVGPEDQSMKTKPKPYRKELFTAGETHAH